MPEEEEVTPPSSGGMSGPKTGLELSDNARREFIVSLADQLRNQEHHLEILQLATQLLGEFLLAQRAGAYCVEDEEIVVQACWSTGLLPLWSGRSPMSRIGAKMAAQYRARQTVVTTDVVAEFMMDAPMTYSGVGVPLFRMGRWQGTFFINRQAGQPWRPNEVSLIEEVAELSWDAHERAQASEQVRETLEILRERESELSAAMHAASLVLYDYDMIHQVMKQSPELNELFGYPPDKVLTLADIRARYHPHISASFIRDMAAQINDPSVKDYETNLHLLLPGGQVRWINGRGEYFRDENGVAVRSLGVVMDVTERKMLEETQRFLVHELDHRIKNVLTTVMAICTHTIRNSDTLQEARIAVMERIKALASAHDVLVRTNWGPAGIKEVIDSATAPYPEMARRISFQGIDCRLSARQALMFALGLHELVTNAVKYGALSNEHGHISVTWNVAGATQDRLIFEWKEIGGPPVARPFKTGFGTRILSEILPAEFDGRSILEYGREGFHFRTEGKLADMPD